MDVAIIGCGGIGRRRAEAVANVDELDLAFCVDVDARAAESLAAAWGAEASTDWDAIIGRDDVDLVIVSTPNFLHAPISIAAAESGKHVLCEKPLARNPEEARAMVQAADDAGVQLCTGFNHRFSAQTAKAIELFRDGAIGDPVFIRARTGHKGGPAFAARWFCSKEKAGGGTFLDNGVHALDLCRVFMDDFVEATGFVATNMWDIDVEDNGFGLFRTDDGRIASLHSSWTQWSGYLFMEVSGTEGWLSINYGPLAETVVNKRDPSGGGSPLQKHYVFGSQPNTWELELREMLKAINGEAVLSADGRDGLRAVEMAYAVYKANETDQAVAL
jgi:predicted dehydrogenase